MLVIYCVISIFILLAISKVIVGEPSEETQEVLKSNEHINMVQNQHKSRPLQPAKPTPWYLLPLQEKK